MPILLRRDFDAARLRLMARESEDADQVRRLLALAAIYDGGSRTEAARDRRRDVASGARLGAAVQCGGPEGLIDRKAPGKPPLLNAEHRAALAAVVESGPIPAVHGVVRWRIIDLCQWVWDEFARQRGQADARPRAACDGLSQAVGATAPSRPGRRGGRGILKKLPALLAAVAREQGLDPGDIEVWFGDEARIGQKNKITRRWARRGTPPARTPGPADRVRLHLRRDLPRSGQGRGSGPALLQHRGDEPAPRGDRRRCRAGRPRRAAARSGRLAPLGQARRAAQHHHRAAAAEVPRAQPGRERLAVHARQLAVQPRVRHPTTTSSITAATPGTSSSTSPGASCPSGCASGRTGSDQRVLVSTPKRRPCRAANFSTASVGPKSR